MSLGAGINLRPVSSETAKQPPVGVGSKISKPKVAEGVIESVLTGLRARNLTRLKKIEYRGEDYGN